MLPIQLVGVLLGIWVLIACGYTSMLTPEQRHRDLVIVDLYLLAIPKQLRCISEEVQMYEVPDFCRTLALSAHQPNQCSPSRLVKLSHGSSCF